MVTQKEVLYTLVESLSTTDGALGQTVYGVQCRYTVAGQPKLCTVADVSPNRPKVEALVRTLTRLQPSPDILPELVADYLESEYTIE